MGEFLRTLLDSLNETLAAGIVIVAASLLLYNLTRNLQNRIARTSAVVLGCVTLVYIGDVLIALNPMVETWKGILRFQWIGLAFIPAATFHLSDALLATTGLPSRGRRRKAVRLLYAVGTIFLILAVFTDSLISPIAIKRVVSIRAESLMPVFVAYFILANLIALYNVGRARQRCLTRSSQRRMTYLLVALLMPSIGIFPYSVLLMPGEEYTVLSLVMVGLGNILVILMLLLLAYPLSFFGSRYPDRIVKAELMRFMLLGPATGVLALAVLFFTDPATQIVGVIGRDFMPFAVVAVILLWLWSVDIMTPTLERRLIYTHEDDEHLAELQRLSERLLTRTDLMQLLDATLEATCDYLQVKRAFVAALIERQPQFVKSVGQLMLSDEALNGQLDALIETFHGGSPYIPRRFEGYWVFPLYSGRITGKEARRVLIGMMGVETVGGDTRWELDDESREMLRVFTKRAGRTLDDMLLQTELYAVLEGLLPQFTVTRSRAAEVEYRVGRDRKPKTVGLPEREQMIELVHAALRHWWGGPGLTSSRLLELQVVQNRANNDDNPAKALRDLLTSAIDSLRPAGERDYKSQEWLFYNILTLRFIDSKRAKDTARIVGYSEANLYRKQNAALEALAGVVLDMEREALQRGESV